MIFEFFQIQITLLLVLSVTKSDLIQGKILIYSFLELRKDLLFLYMVLDKFLEQNAVQLGFRNLFDFVLQQQLKMYQEKYTPYAQTIQQFEQKYQMNYEQFLSGFSSIELSIFEKEDDGMNWEIAIHQAEFCQAQIQELQHAIQNIDEIPRRDYSLFDSKR